MFGLALGASLGAATAGAAAGGATAGMVAGGGLMAGIGAGLGSLAFGGAGGGAGLFGAGGQFALPQAMGTAGMGMGLAQTFQGTASGVHKKYTESKGSKKSGKALEKLASSQLSGSNLASPIIKKYMSTQKGRLKAMAQEQRRASQGGLNAMGARDVQTGMGAGGAIAAAGQSIEGRAAPEKWAGQFQQQDYMKGITGAQNLMNTELENALYTSGGDFANDYMTRLQGAGQGQALGNAARYMMMLKYPPYQNQGQ